MRRHTVTHTYTHTDLAASFLYTLCRLLFKELKLLFYSTKIFAFALFKRSTQNSISNALLCLYSLFVCALCKMLVFVNDLFMRCNMCNDDTLLAEREYGMEWNRLYSHFPMVICWSILTLYYYVNEYFCEVILSARTLLPTHARLFRSLLHVVLLIVCKWAHLIGVNRRKWEYVQTTISHYIWSRSSQSKMSAPACVRVWESKPHE